MLEIQWQKPLRVRGFLLFNISENSSKCGFFGNIVGILECKIDKSNKNVKKHKKVCTFYGK